MVIDWRVGYHWHMSIIRPVSRLLPGRVPSALLAAIVAVALVPAMAGADGAHHLIFRLSGRSHQDVLDSGAILVNAHCPAEACTVVAMATSKSPAFHTAKVHARVPAGAAASLSLPLGPRRRDRLKAALEAGHSPTLTVKATAHDRVGNKILLSLTVRPFEP
jgi:hypothetical protein